MIPQIFAAWAGHTEVSREIANNLRAAIEQHYGQGCIKVAATEMGLGLEDLSKQLAGVKPLNLLRLGYLPVEVYRIFLSLEAKRVGGMFIEPALVDYLRAAARLGVKKMKQMGLSFSNNETRKSA